MEIVSKLVRVRKRSKVEKAAHAVIVSGSADYFTEVKTDNLRSSEGSDGRIKRLSAHALGRLRDAIARTAHKVGEYRVYGCCLTIPWGSKDPNAIGNPTQEVASKIWSAWTHNLSRLLDAIQCGIIYRVELQSRKTPHWHLMVYLPCSMDYNKTLAALIDGFDKFPPEWHLFLTAKKRNGQPMIAAGDASADLVAATHYLALLLLRRSWLAALNRVHFDLECEETARAFDALAAPVASGASDAAAVPPVKSWDYCFDAIHLDGVKSGVAYLASHTTKHKQEQLGYVGKQWGYLGKKWLHQPPPVVLGGGDDLVNDYRVRVVAFRTMRKWLKVNRSATDWIAARPRRLLIEDAEIFKGLVVRNVSSLYLFGVPDEVIFRAFDHAINAVWCDPLTDSTRNGSTIAPTPSTIARPSAI